MGETFKPDSSNISNVSYDPSSRVMEVTFASGGTYAYSGVEPAHFQGMKDSDSAGSYLARHIKGRHAFKKL